MPIQTLLRLGRSGSVLSFATNVSVIGLGLLNSIILSRQLAAEGRGEIAAAMLWPILLAYLGNAGLIEAMVFSAAQQVARLGTLFANGLCFATTISVLVIPVGYFVMPALLGAQPDDVVTASQAYLLIVPLVTLAEFNAGLLQGRLHIRAVNAQRLVVPIGYLLGTLCLVALGNLSVNNVIWLHLVLGVVRTGATFVALFSYRVPLSLKPDLHLARSMIGYGGKVHIGSLPKLANWRFDQLLIAAWMPPVQLGLYVAAVNACQPMLALAEAVRLGLAPKVAREADAVRRLAMFRQSFETFWLVCLLAFIPMFVAVTFGIPLVFGSSFADAVPVAQVLLVAITIMSAKEVFGAGVRALNMPWLSSKAELIASFVTVVLLVVMLRRTGIIGAAVVSVVAYAIALAFLVRGLAGQTGVNALGWFVPGRGSMRSLVCMVAGRPLPREGMLNEAP